MRVIEKEEIVVKQVIDEHKITVKKFVADDGAEFDTERECFKYEMRQDLIESIRGIPRQRILNLDGFYAYSFYIRTQKEFETVLNYLSLSKEYVEDDAMQPYAIYQFNERDKCRFNGEDWYIFESKRDSNGYSSYIEELSSCKQIINEFLAHFEE